MPYTKLTLNYDIATRSFDRFTRPAPGSPRWRLIPLPKLLDVLTRVGAITQPECVSLVAEERSQGSHERVRLIVCDHHQSPAVGVTRDFEASELTTSQLCPGEVAGAIQKLLDLANDLLQPLHALTLGRERIALEVDYSDPRNLIVLLGLRGCTIPDRDAVERVVAEDPGRFYYGDSDLADDGTDWSHGGGPWADRVEKRLLKAQAISRP